MNSYKHVEVMLKWDLVSRRKEYLLTCLQDQWPYYLRKTLIRSQQVLKVLKVQEVWIEEIVKEYMEKMMRKEKKTWVMIHIIMSMMLESNLINDECFYRSLYQIKIIKQTYIHLILFNH